MSDIPYLYRLLALVAVGATIAVVDLLRHPQEPTRVFEYSVLAIAGVTGALYGSVNDLITSWLSPEYFTMGKGLSPGEGLTARAMALGAQAGGSAGIVVCAIWVYTSGTLAGTCRVRMARVLGGFWIPLVCAVALAVTLPISAGDWDPLGFGEIFQGVLSPSQIARFRCVWWIHVGDYAGLLLGGIIGVLQLRRRAKNSGPPVAAPAQRFTD